MLRAHCTLESFKPLDSWSRWCWNKNFLPSGHCVACLTNPHLLLETPFNCGCHCVDHRNLWYNLRDVVIWNVNMCQDLGPEWKWPECGIDIVEPRKRKKIFRNYLRAMQRKLHADSN
ncbi:RH2 [Odocoileus adenovirus 1]|uniref:RH2 n=2 Tax=Deer atadenovirus A TaxID=2169706 RepID=A0A515MFT7_9ADEN|nr:RH2 [Odocoileus adenovirus 1]QDM55337.1 RH2 [Deer atadenovirus A]ASU50491.1 RH2 [Odocoileus adenovirus 1]ASU50518.1 RH2 [Odocoileus adenovirus 1]ASU50545.1 RH2 [Odocoileus adenovirus 1]ASU50572.1 RH2 [Odocoileus adenovirus 1]